MRRHLPALVALAALGLSLVPSAASAHQGNPNMESIVRAVTPATAGIKLQVLNRDDRFELTNRSNKDVVLYGYNGEQYARVMADGTVQENVNSPAYYLNTERDANVPVPPNATSKATPRWKTLDRTGSFQWHDHRMHYMGQGVPPSVKDDQQRQKVQDYSIPIRIGATKGAITGAYWWSPQPGGGPPAGAIVALVVLVLGGAAAALVVTRRRRGLDRDHDDDDEGSRPSSAKPPVEAW